MASRPRALFMTLGLVLALAAPLQAADPSPSPGTSPGTSPASSPSTSPPTGEATLPAVGVDFGAYTLVPLLSGDATYAGPATPHSLTGVSVSSDIRQLLKDPTVLHGLLRKGFVDRAFEDPALQHGLRQPGL